MKKFITVLCITKALLTTSLAMALHITFHKHHTMTFKNLATEVNKRTSITLNPQIKVNSNYQKEPWLWVDSSTNIFATKNKLMQWLKSGGMLIIEEKEKSANLAQTAWKPIPVDDALMRSFYLLKTLPACESKHWQGYTLNDRIAIIYIPYPLLAYLQDKPQQAPCLKTESREQQVRIFINLLMVALATDYKKDQVHLPEILKRLR